jgi:hypothetical protein
MTDEELSSSDWRRIEAFYGLWPMRRCGPKQFCSGLSAHVFVPLYNAGLSPESSALFRSAILVLMSKLQTEESDVDVPRHFNLFYRRAQELLPLVNTATLLESVYSWYIIAVYGLIAEDSIDKVLINCLQFCRLLKTASARVGIKELSWLEALWQGVLSSIFYVCRHLSFNNANDNGEQFIEVIWEKVQQILDESSCLLPSDSDIAELPLSMCTETICQKVGSLAIYMQFYLDRFLFRASNHSRTEGVEPATVRLHKILELIIPLINHLSNISDYIHHAYKIRPNILNLNTEFIPDDFLHFTSLQPRGLKSAASATYRDSALILLYAFVRLIKALLELTREYDTTALSKINKSAIALCRVCGSFPRHAFNPIVAPLLIKRSLFWAGLILGKSQFPAGR